MVFYGDRDWMNVELAKSTIESIRGTASIASNVEPLKIVKDCGHQMMLENPLGVAKIIIKTFQKWTGGPIDPSLARD